MNNIIYTRIKNFVIWSCVLCTWLLNDYWIDTGVSKCIAVSKHFCCSVLIGGVMTGEWMELVNAMEGDHVHHCPRSCVFSHIMSSRRTEHAIWMCVIGKEMVTIFVMGHHNMELSTVPFCYAVICRMHGTVFISHFWFLQCCCWRFRSSGMWCCLVGSVAPQVGSGLSFGTSGATCSAHSSTY